MSDPNADVADVLNKVLQRLDRLEQKVDALGGGNPLGASLADPDTAAALGRILAKADTLEEAVGRLEQVQRRLPAIGDFLATMANQAWNGAEADGIDLVGRAEAAVPIALKASSPEVLAMADRMLDRLDSVDFLAATADSAYHDLKESGADVDAIVKQGVQIALRLAKVAQTPEFEALLRSGALEAATLEVVSKASTALVRTREEPPEQVGFFGLLRAMGDPDVQRATGFLFKFARRFGKALS